MPAFFSSTLLLTLLLAIGLVFFLRAASKDRTTIVEVYSPLPALEVLNGISSWLEKRGWERNGGNAEEQILAFKGKVAFSKNLAIFLSLLGGLGSSCLGLVIRQIYPPISWWPLLLAIIGAPSAGFIYRQRADRVEELELRLVKASEQRKGSKLRIKAHRDELIALELGLKDSLKLASDGALLSSPI
tara:strand:- start:216 stop:776 length:561 start_codon:yes stop_codon:yes gene_type:complete